MAVEKTVQLFSVPELGKDYEHTFSFGSLAAQKSFFNRRSRGTYRAKISVSPERITLAIDKDYQSLELIDYIGIPDAAGKTIYYFVTERKPKTTSVTIFELEVDVIQTYMFNVTFLDSFVDRCHVPRWNGDVPTREIIDEGLPTTNYMEVEKKQLYKLPDQYLIVASDIIGKSEEYVYSPPTGGGGGISDCWLEGKVSPDGFRFMKGYEGFGAYSYKDSEGIPTIGYGVASHANPDLYNELLKEQPISEERAAKVSYELKIKNYGLPILNAFKEFGCTEQQQFDALVDLAFNSGTGSITGSNSLTNAIRQDPTNEAVIRPIWESFKTNGGLAGLVARRKAECDIYFNGVYEKRAIVTIKPNGGYGPPVTENNGDGWLPSGCGGGSTPVKGVLEVAAKIEESKSWYTWGGKGAAATTDNWRKQKQTYPYDKWCFGPGGYGDTSDLNKGKRFFDCSGFVSWCYWFGAGIKITAFTNTMKTECNLIAKDSLKPGDIIFTSGGLTAAPQHVILFKEWIDKAKGTFKSMEAMGTTILNGTKTRTWKNNDYQGARPKAAAGQIPKYPQDNDDRGNVYDQAWQRYPLNWA